MIPECARPQLVSRCLQWINFEDCLGRLARHPCRTGDHFSNSILFKFHRRSSACSGSSRSRSNDRRGFSTHVYYSLFPVGVLVVTQVAVAMLMVCVVAVSA